MKSNPLPDPLKPDIKILVVDDREDNLFSIEAILEKDHYTIVKANSGRAALKILLSQHDFSLILMDVQMPDLGGFETATIIYERDKLRNIPIIFITAHNYDEDYIFKGYRMGGVDYIYKPINPELLRAKVGVFVELYRKNLQLLQHERKLMATNRSLQKEVEERKISEEKVQSLNQQLIENNAHLQAMNEELDRFAYVASHDLQEPLRKIMVFSDKILMKSDHDLDTRKYFQKIIQSSRRMQSLINDLLSYSRPSMIPADLTATDLNQIVKDAITEMEVEIEKTGATIHVGKLPEVYGVPSLLWQLFYNLINNALKFRKSSVIPNIHIESHEAGSMRKRFPERGINGGKYHLISVTDNGIGFDPKYAEEIFVVFKRLHSYHEYEGTGVGLSICKKIIEKHHGFITVETHPDKGSSFLIGFPESINYEVRST
ncbi:MAG TPA: response regulator [Chitinophagaceae bacterium]|nr:response regulator [Chitinophagaceae bacterium]